MNKEFEKFEKEFKKIAAKTKNIKTDANVKIRKQLIDALEKAWDFHDDIKDEIADANKQGLTGNKIADYDSHNGFVGAYNGWYKAVYEHKKQIAALKGFHGNASAKHDELKKIYDGIVRDLTKAKLLKDAPKEVKAVLKAAEDELKRLVAIMDLYGSLKVPELFYAAKEDQSMQMIVKKAAQKASGKELPKIFEVAVSKKNINLAQGMQKNVKEACDKAREAAGGNEKEAKKQMKLAHKYLDNLKKLNGSYEAAAKKMAKELEKAPNKKEVESVIKEIDTLYEDTAKLLDKAEAEVKKEMA